MIVTQERHGKFQVRGVTSPDSCGISSLAEFI
jgi:hypothetical protein